MLIIFDLDDTLVDTSGCVTYYKLEKALHAMRAGGLQVSDFTEALRLLRRLNDRALSAKIALAEFVGLQGGAPSLLELGIKEIYESDLENLSLSPLEGAVSVLTFLKQKHTLALVSMGIPLLQMQKLEKAGIDSSLFSKILITQEDDKKSLYEQVCREVGVLEEKRVVCGDRIQRDLAPAKKLGWTTVLMKWGRGLAATLPSPDVDYAISSLAEFQSLVESGIIR